MLAEALKSVPQSKHPDLLVGFNKADDAGVFRLSENLALVQTVDFFPPIVDDPYWFGQIAAANALSDIFAMGGKPLTAMNIVGFPAGTMPLSILGDILRGGAAKVEEAGAVVVGGHSIKDKELKFGVSVTGIIDPNKVITNSGAKTGDILILTKPLGTGLITTGIKRNVVSDDLAMTAIQSMAMLNRTAGELMVKHHAHAATDITGFGLLGHANEMASGSGVTIRLIAQHLPLLPDVLKLAELGMIPGGANDNRDYLQQFVRVNNTVAEDLEAVLFDPQTSGGLLIAMTPRDTDAFVAEAKQLGLLAARVGSVEMKTDKSVIVD